MWVSLSVYPKRLSVMIRIQMVLGKNNYFSGCLLFTHCFKTEGKCNFYFLVFITKDKVQQSHSCSDALITVFFNCSITHFYTANQKILVIDKIHHSFWDNAYNSFTEIWSTTLNPKLVLSKDIFHCKKIFPTIFCHGLHSSFI